MNSEISAGLEQLQALQRQGRFDEAGQALQRLLARFPQEPALHRAMAMLAQHAGRPQQALASILEAVRMAPDSSRLQLESGQLLAANGDTASACEAFSRAVALQPDLLEGWLLLGMTLYGAQRDAEALPALRRAHRLAPEHADALRALAEVEFALEHYEQALPRFERLLASMPSDPQLRLRLGRCHARTGAPERARALYRDMLQQAPQGAELWAALGQAEEELGDAASAGRAYAQAHALRPGWADPIGGLLMLDRAGASAELLVAATAMAASAATPEAERAYLHYALGKVHDARGAYADAMRHWREANRLRRARTGPLDRDALRQRVDDAKAAFTPELFASLRGMGLADPRPLFIVGMPRSGTTLVEQVIATHPQAHGAGELTALAQIADSLPASGVRWPQDAARLDAATLRRHAERYLATATRGTAATALRIGDKQPYNFFHVGLAGLLFPQARVVWCRRDPRDIALSIYAENFAMEAGYATDFGDIAYLVDAQEALMRHWQQVAALPILEVDYERLVADFEAEARRIVEFAGLAWDIACLQFHANPRAVQTPSRWQVRQPVHGRSVGRWRNYAAWLPPADGDGQ